MATFSVEIDMTTEELERLLLRTLYTRIYNRARTKAYRELAKKYEDEFRHIIDELTYTDQPKVKVTRHDKESLVVAKD